MRKTGLCSGCGVVRTPENTDKAGKRGLSAYCKECKAGRDKTRAERQTRYREKHGDPPRTESAMLKRRQKNNDRVKAWRAKKKRDESGESAIAP